MVLFLCSVLITFFGLTLLYQGYFHVFQPVAASFKENQEFTQSVVVKGNVSKNGKYPYHHHVEIKRGYQVAKKVLIRCQEVAPEA